MHDQSEHVSPLGRDLLSRRNFLSQAGTSMGALGLAKLLSADKLLGSGDDPTAFSGKQPIRPDIDPNNPYASRPPHYSVPAKNVLVIFCPGAVSHVDTFDYKPALAKLHGKPAPFAHSRGRQEIVPNLSGILRLAVRVVK